MTIVDLAVYKDGKREDNVPLDSAFEAGREPGALVWIGLHEPTEDEFDAVRREFGLHELAVEDAMKGHQRPKLEVYGDEQLFIVLKTAHYSEPDTLEFGEILMFVGDQYVVTVRHGEATPLHDVRGQLEQRPEMLRCGTGAVMHAVMDRVVDDYQPVLTNLDIDITELEAQAFGDDPQRGLTERVYRLKRQVINLHRATAPLTEPLGRLSDGRYAHVHEDLRPYFRDVYDHLLRTVTTADQFRELLTSILEANLTQVTVRQNEQMRQISAWAAILAVPTLIAGIYGMNFRHMPELHWRFGYPAVVVVMVLLCAALYSYFRRIEWL
ncbi:MAG TPA: magnesium/cobalt transporter CorA [Thermoleophilaceae bacterium]|jgi:magnesium transporter|nr:magnesium/cobalt transporter CorA [Thermoleophilaceae bacterium]